MASFTYAIQVTQTIPGDVVSGPGVAHYLETSKWSLMADIEQHNRRAVPLVAYDPAADRVAKSSRVWIEE